MTSAPRNMTGSLNTPGLSTNTYNIYNMSTVSIYHVNNYNLGGFRNFSIPNLAITIKKSVLVQKTVIKKSSINSKTQCWHINVT